MSPVTRRGLIVAGLGLGVVSAQVETGKPASTKEEDLMSARQAMQANSEKLAAVKVPLAVEPAFVFKA